MVSSSSRSSWVFLLRRESVVDAPLAVVPYLPVEGVLAIPPAVLLHLDALAVVLLVLHGDVVAALAVLAGQRDLHSLLTLRHRLALLLVDLGDAAGADGAATLTDGEPQTLVH